MREQTDDRTPDASRGQGQGELPGIARFVVGTASKLAKAGARNARTRVLRVANPKVYFAQELLRQVKKLDEFRVPPEEKLSFLVRAAENTIREAEGKGKSPPDADDANKGGTP